MTRVLISAFLAGMLVAFFICGIIWPNEHSMHYPVPLEAIKQVEW